MQLKKKWERKRKSKVEKCQAMEIYLKEKIKRDRYRGKEKI
jgi:hypothetical protein